MSPSESLHALPSPDHITRWLIGMLILVIISCWSAMVWSTYVTYKAVAPIPTRFVSPSNAVVITGEDIIAGKSGFQQADLMDYGSLYGMGSYFGDDYTAKYLVALATSLSDQLALTRYQQPYNRLSQEKQAAVKITMQNMLRQINLTQPIVQLSQPLANTIKNLRIQIVHDLQTDNLTEGWTHIRGLTPQETLQTADFLIYSSLTTVAYRPGENYTWTNNWPYEPIVGNQPTTATFTWSWASLTFLFFCIGLIVAIFKLYIEKEKDAASLEAKLQQFLPLTPSQYALVKYFLVVSLLLLVQIAVGAIMAHYYTERTSFYGIHVDKWLPFTFLRDLHIQIPIVWIGLGWISAALFLAPIIGKREPRGQRHLVNFLFWVSMLIVVGVVVGNYFGLMGHMKKTWFWFGNQGLSYLEIGRFWQILFFIGLLLWSLMMLRSMWPTLASYVKPFSFFQLFRLENLLWYSSLGVAVIYAFGMIPLHKVNPSFTLTDFWRWWVVHLWVEWAFELFTAAIVGYFLMAVGLVSRQLAERAVIFEWILILGSGILGTGHHLWWAGEPSIWLSLGSVFSFLEVLPLFLLVLEAVQQYQHLQSNKTFPYRLAFLYILGSAFWNFVGAGVFGGATINAPLVNYYEHGTFLTLNHAHTSMFGAFGMLAIGLIYLALRYMSGNQIRWSDKMGVWAFWLYNGGLVLWVALNFFPIGWPQLNAVYEHGYNYARSLAFYNTTTFWQWMRFPGDVVFAAAALLMAYDFFSKGISVLKKK